MTSEAARLSDARDAVPFRMALRAWFAISLQTFGGPAGQIAVMQRTLVEEKRWVGQGRFLHALNYCMLLPGPEAQQLAIYIGWLLARMRPSLATPKPSPPDGGPTPLIADDQLHQGRGSTHRWVTILVVGL